MAKPQISIRWSSELGHDYQASVAALEQYDPRPELKASLGVKGYIPSDIMTRIVNFIQDVASEEVNITVSLTGTWDEEFGPRQMRLWDPPKHRAETGGGQVNMDEVLDKAAEEFNREHSEPDKDGTTATMTVVHRREPLEPADEELTDAMRAELRVNIGVIQDDIRDRLRNAIGDKDVPEPALFAEQNPEIEVGMDQWTKDQATRITNLERILGETVPVGGN